MELRSGTRLQANMPAGASTSVTPSPPVTPPPTPAPRFLLRQRDPPTFTADGSIAVEDWLHQVQRICNYNNWDDTLRLSNIPFYLSGIPLTWYENNEASFDSWATFQRLLKEAFGNKEEEISKAKQYLESRHQGSAEPFTAYMADVLQACRKINPDMTEAEKIRHLLKGLTQTLFTAVALHKLATVSELSTTCKRFEDLQRQRILPEASSLPPCATPSCDNVQLTMLIRTIVREELERIMMDPIRRLAPPAHRPSQVTGETSLRQLVQEELKSVASPPVTPVVPEHRPSYAEVCAAINVSSTPDFGAPTLTARSPVPTPPILPDTQYFRPAYRQPVICFYCHLPGHIARRCFRRQFDMQQERAWYASGSSSPRSPPSPPRFRRETQFAGTARGDDAYNIGEPAHNARWNRSNVSGRHNSPSPPTPRPLSRSPSPRMTRRRSVSPLLQTFPKYSSSN